MKESKYIIYPWSSYCPKNLEEYLENTRYIMPVEFLSDIKIDFFNEIDFLSEEEMQVLINALYKNCTVIDKEKIKDMFNEMEFINQDVNWYIKYIENKNKYDRLIRHFESFVLIKERLDKLTKSTIRIFNRCNLENKITNIKWVADLQKETEYVDINNEKTIILSYSQVSDFAKIIISSFLMNEDSLTKFENYDLIKKMDSIDKNDLINYFLMQGIDINDFLNHVYEKKINYKIILKDVYGIIADIMFIHGCYDAAFHYIQQSNLIYATNVEVHIYRERYEELSNNNKSWILNMEELITYISSVFLLAHEIHHIELKDKLNIPLNIVYNWYFVGMNTAEKEYNKILKHFTSGICERSSLIIKELEAGIGKDKFAHQLLNACKSEITSWTRFYNVYKDIENQINNQEKDSDLFQNFEECYCDFMALYDVLEEADYQLHDVIIAIDLILKILVIQESNHMIKQMIDFIDGKTKIIKQKYIVRIQLFVIGILNEIYIIKCRKQNKNMNSEIIDNIPCFNVFTKFYGTANFDFEFEEGIQSIFEGLDEIHEYYYKSVVYTVFHVYQDGYVNKDFKGMFVKSEIGNEESIKSVFDLQSLCNSVTYKKLVKNIENNIKKLKKENPNINIIKMDEMLKILNIDEILNVYAKLHKNQLFE